MRKMHSPLVAIGTGLGQFAGRIRLPPGERYQVVHFSNGTVRYLYGNVASPALYPAVLGASPIMVHPGTEVFLQIEQAAGTICYIHVVGGIADKANESGYERKD